MKTRIAGTIALVMALSVAAPASAETGNEMLQNCAEFLKENGEIDGYFKSGVCAGFVSGVTNTVAYARDASPATVKICIPDGFTIGQGIRVLKKYLIDHPKDLHRSATALALTAYREAYPCD